ncbi:MAG: TlyA family RNA methyltransferase [Clostridiales Family XIII bacterium]|jgi:23S rRNA (cytidine1920-2'-O)/16S rRNA (cytidine1409-2'-O)-methyltransferase|nr:TlyA family RNA methyltransferase [Clostridiales Family XIII bacterium]
MEKVKKERLDVLLTERGFFGSRERARASVMAGVVKVDGQPATKPGVRYPADADIAVTEPPHPYVGRGGLKLEYAFDQWKIDVSGAVCADIGASTGGFTDLMLRRGARKIYAIDVGYGQLDWKLRGDPRVVNLERTNVRYLDATLVDEAPSFIAIDVSFISLKLVLPVAASLLALGGQIVALVKPQFEAGRGQVGKNGVVRDESVRREVVEKARGYAEENGLSVSGVIESPITGAKGNIEYLMRCASE